jgi:hypothetical protein
MTEGSTMASFHIHVDASSISPTSINFLVRNLGFWRADFVPSGGESYAPEFHLTTKPTSGKEFRQKFKQLIDWARVDGNVRGYVEGEHIASRHTITHREFDESVPLPFTTTRKRLKEGFFRESEIHVTMNRDASDPRVLSRLAQIGFFSARVVKPYGIAEVMTIQGSKDQIEFLTPTVVQYLDRVGGCADCVIKEERIADWWVSDNRITLPPVIDLITSYGLGHSPHP